MIQDIKQAFSILHKEEKKKIYIFLTYISLLIFFEAFGVALVPLYINWLLMDNSEQHIFSVIGLNKEYIWQIGAVIAVIVSIGIYASYFIIREILFISQSIGARVSTALFEKLVFKNNNEDISKVVNKVTMECDRYASFIITPIFFIFSRIILALALVSFLLTYNYKYALSVIILITLLFYFIFRSARKSVSESGNLITKSNTNRLHEVKSIFALKREFILYDKVRSAVTRYSDVANTYGKNRAFVEVISKQPRYVFEAVVLIGGILISLILTRSDDVDALGFLLMFGVIGYKLMPAIHQAQSYYTVFNGNLSCVKELSILSDKIESESLPRFDTYPEIKELSSLYIKNVKLLRDGEEIQFKDILLEKGNIYGLTGPSGSGKSTFLELVSGFIPNDLVVEFEIILNGHEILDYDYYQNVTRKNTAYLPQFSNTYGSSVSESILLEKGEDKSEHIFGRFTWAFRINEDSNDYLDERLSGGEKQRLNIARTLFYNRSIYLFDESLSGVDNKTRINIWKDLRRMLNDKIVIVISHDQMDHKKVDMEIRL